MSDYSYVADRAKKAHASVSRLEAALQRAPQDRGLQINLASMRRLAEQARSDLNRLAAINHIEVCNYRLSPEFGDGYALEHVASSFLEYQLLFSQIYDAFANGPKSNAVIGAEAKAASTLDFAFSYSGSLGIVLLAKSERDFIEGNLDKPIDALYQIMDVSDVDNVKDIANNLGRAVVKRVHDWSKATVKGGFAADIRWKRSDGVERGQVIARSKLEKIAEIIDRTSDEKTIPISVAGTLVGIDVNAKTFHFVVPDGESYKGKLDDQFSLIAQNRVPAPYVADISMIERQHYATDVREVKNVLRRLNPLPLDPLSIALGPPLLGG
ncbi:hypothetical protein LB554_23005 [Mesorhizobium sp. CO1-1-11]|uniref:hypothetical protein n=1 Tax=Mesorhizobium sp. CO1-1-11 TaxID=2876636 RepID=UPI001CCB04DF|nr:hypothetical protein [Mesorhizobium sp. CO1-1-11]MBZ9726815.1 hypothetical protein [Mesorhizobium sp. CO1-1-11]